MLHITGTHLATITAHQTGDANHFAAPDVSQSFTIGQATPQVQLSADGGTFTGCPSRQRPC